IKAGRGSTRSRRSTPSAAKSRSKRSRSRTKGSSSLSYGPSRARSRILTGILTMDRRTFLKGGGVVLVLVAGGGVWRAYDQGIFGAGEGPAYEPWRDWRKSRERGPLILVRAAILAASPHNTQPWLFKISSARIELYLDPQRNVGALDPFLREAHIGLGCALENLMLAAAANGYAASATLSAGKLERIPAEPKQLLMASVDLVPGEALESELYAAIPKRHTNRSPYDPKQPVPNDVLESLRGLAADETEIKL